MTATATTPHPPEAHHPFDDTPVIHRYTRADAIRYGMLADVTETAREAGFRIPVAVTAAVQDQCVRWTEDDARRKPQVHQDEDGRLWDVLWMAACKAREVARSGPQRVQFAVPGHRRPAARTRPPAPAHAEARHRPRRRRRAGGHHHAARRGLSAQTGGILRDEAGAGNGGAVSIPTGRLPR